MLRKEKIIYDMFEHITEAYTHRLVYVHCNYQYKLAFVSNLT